MPADFPAVSLLLFAYRQEAYIAAAVAAALAQDYPNLEILISDDFSPDATFAIIQEAVAGYRGPHRVCAIQSPHNLGLAEHVRRITAMATGELFVMGAGDDNSAPRRILRTVQAWQAAGCGPAMLYSDYRALGGQGEVLAERSPVIVRKPPSFGDICRGVLDVHGASSAVTASLVREFAPMAPDVIHEDRVFPFRALLLGGQIIYIDETLIDYRVHGGISRLPLDPTVANAFRLQSERRKLADARQRLIDLLYKRPGDRQAARICQATIENHRCRIAFAQARPRSYETHLVHWIARGARPAEALKTYAKHRLRSLGIRVPFGGQMEAA